MTNLVEKIKNMPKSIKITLGLISTIGLPALLFGCSSISPAIPHNSINDLTEGNHKNDYDSVISGEPTIESQKELEGYVSENYLTTITDSKGDSIKVFRGFAINKTTNLQLTTVLINNEATDGDNEEIYAIGHFDPEESVFYANHLLIEGSFIPVYR